MQRRPSTQDLTWLLDLHRNKQLDIDPPYQRRSVWTRRDMQFFLDTIFRNYPSPAIFLHKTISDTGQSTYHVVDGKQRIQTILNFVDDKLKVADDFGDTRLDGKRWSELQGEPTLRQALWNYQITVEMIDAADGSVVNEVFDRLNRNARRLTRQELRHAKFEGWLITEAETESAQDAWRRLRVTSTTRSRRMTDTQFLSELMLVVLEARVLGFDQDTLDDLYAKYDVPSELTPELDIDDFRARFAGVRDLLVQMEQHNACITTFASGFGHLYSLWALLVLGPTPADIPATAERYAAFMEKVTALGKQPDLDAFLQAQPAGAYTQALLYFNNARGASTDLGPRTERLAALSAAVLG
jgi:hypothetical protein